MDPQHTDMLDHPVDDAAGSKPASRCPIDHTAFGDTAVCPFPVGAGPTGPVHRSRADMFMRRLLRIHERPAGVTTARTYVLFRRSMFISAVRCLLTYIFFPFVLPAVGFATGVGPIIGLTIGSVAIVCDVYTVRRFFQVDHKWRWHATAVAFCVICLLAVLLVQDVAHLLS